MPMGREKQGKIWERSGDLFADPATEIDSCATRA